ncbi:recombination mediator RecR [Flavobacteriales bacterium]|jgi:recombination protein RecR|nr:recombination mediator RecR [Flavobacteriales bacterium]MDB2653233.1 recombination mediator RecR [Flavobacteriales bacterium]MDG1145704.1 recombination mediator RecR [Flavobacteriales bacterium]MDG1396247.1 recombination mediator RecR [Flavobacteriales bacterium]
MNFSSKLLEKAVEEFSKLPGIGKKTALRLVLNLLKREKEDVRRFSNALVDLREGIQYCTKCHNISDLEICQLCANPNRDDSVLCIVEDIRDVMAVENTQQFKGLYHVLGGVISPMEGVGPQHLSIDSLLKKVDNGEVNEIIFALSSTMEGDTTNFYIFKKLKNYDIKVSTIARGIAFGDELEYADEITLGRSIVNRLPYENAIKS